MKLQLKRSNVLDLGKAKEPTPDQMEYGELAVNYNDGDPAIFLKDSANNIIRISGVGNISDDGQVEIPGSVNPPTNPSEGNLWYNAEDGRLYVYYNDGNSSQWVDASPDNWQGSNTIPDPNDLNQQPGTLDDRYVNKLGDNMTGDLTLGTDKITLNAADGSITAAGDITSSTDVYAGGEPAGGTASGVRLQSIGKIYVARTSGIIFEGFTTGDATPNISLNANGSVISGALSTQNNTSTVNYLWRKTTTAGDAILRCKSNVTLTTGADPFAVLANGDTEISGNLGIGGLLPTAPNISLNASGAIVAKKASSQFSGIYLTDAAGGIDVKRRFNGYSIGTATLPIYIGNAQIQVTSDRRLKENIKDTELDALEAIQKIKVKDFTWNDPNDQSFNNKNARGVWTGIIAQEVVEILPFVVNAPRKEEDLSIDHENEGTWTLDQSQLCPVLIKALQQALTRIEALEAEVNALKGN